MLFAIKNCLDLKLYTQEGKEVYSIDYANDAIFRINEWEAEAFLCLKHEFTDFDLVKLKYDGYKEMSDFEKETSNLNVTIRSIHNRSEYKAIGIFEIKNADMSVKKVKIVFDKICFGINTCNKIKFNDEEVSKFSTIFQVMPNESGDYCHISEVYNA